jgi:hypothetical protein
VGGENFAKGEKNDGKKARLEQVLVSSRLPLEFEREVGTGSGSKQRRMQPEPLQIVQKGAILRVPDQHSKKVFQQNTRIRGISKIKPETGGVRLFILTGG